MRCAARSTCSAAWPSAMPVCRRAADRVSDRHQRRRHHHRRRRHLRRRRQCRRSAADVGRAGRDLCQPGGARPGARQAELCLRGPRPAGRQEHRPAGRGIPGGLGERGAARAKPSRRRWQRFTRVGWRWVAAGVLALGVAAIAVWTLPQFWKTGVLPKLSPAAVTADVGPLSIVVLPFRTSPATRTRPTSPMG